MKSERYKETSRKLKNLFDRYGVGFNMACGYLMENGFVTVRNMTDEDFEKIKQKLYEEKEEAREKGVTVVGTEFQLHIIELAKEITTISTEMELLMYQKEMPWNVGIEEPEYYKKIIQNLINLMFEEKVDEYDDFEDEWMEFQEDLKEKLLLDDEEYDDLWVMTRR